MPLELVEVPRHRLEDVLQHLNLASGKQLAEDVAALEKVGEMMALAYQSREAQTIDGLLTLRSTVAARASMPAGQVVGASGELQLIDELLRRLQEGGA